MTVVGYNLKKLTAERKKPLVGQVNISSQIHIKDVEKILMDIGPKKDAALRCLFHFQVDYQPDVATIEIDGDTLYIPAAKEFDPILKNWKEKKELPSAMRIEVLNFALAKCSIEALILSKEFNLPSPVPMPRIEEKK